LPKFLRNVIGSDVSALNFYEMDFMTATICAERMLLFSVQFISPLGFVIALCYLVILVSLLYFIIDFDLWMYLYISSILVPPYDVNFLWLGDFYLIVPDTYAGWSCYTPCMDS